MRGGGVREDVKREVKFLWKFKKNLGGGVGSGGGGGRGRVEGVRVDVNREVKFL